MDCKGNEPVLNNHCQVRSLIVKNAHNCQSVIDVVRFLLII